MKHGKKYIDAAKLIESSKTYDPSEALELCCKTATAKFDETVEVHFRLGIDTRQADQQPDDPVGNTFWRTVDGGRRRAKNRRFFVRGPVVRNIGISVTTRHYFFSTSRSSFSSTRCVCRCSSGVMAVRISSRKSSATVFTC